MYSPINLCNKFCLLNLFAGEGKSCWNQLIWTALKASKALFHGRRTKVEKKSSQPSNNKEWSGIVWFCLRTEGDLPNQMGKVREQTTGIQAGATHHSNISRNSNIAQVEKSHYVPSPLFVETKIVNIWANFSLLEPYLTKANYTRVDVFTHKFV